MSFWQKLIECAGGLTLTDGRYCSGYILKYTNDWVEFQDGGPKGNQIPPIRIDRSEVSEIWCADKDGIYRAHTPIPLSVVPNNEWLEWKSIAESRWFSRYDYSPAEKCLMLEVLEERGEITISQRKWRLFAVACLHQIRQLFPDRRIRQLVDSLRDVADGTMNWKTYRRMYNEMNHPSEEDDSLFHARFALRLASLSVLDNDICREVAERSLEALGGNSDKDETTQDELLLDIFGNPFDCQNVQQSWLSWNNATIPRLAQAIYDDCAFERMGILADALEESGCDNESILRHCRNANLHVHGCWLIDLLTGKH